VCTLTDRPYYIPHSNVGITTAQSNSQGTKITIGWEKAYPSPFSLRLAYNIYYSTDFDSVFSEGPKYISIDPTVFSLEINEFVPGDTFYFAVRATQWQNDWINLDLLPDSGDSKIYPDAILLQTLGVNDTSIFLSNISSFPNSGIIEIGNELIQYSNRDLLNNSVTNLIRGFLDTNVREHQPDGYDGYHLESPIVAIWKGLEEQNFKIHSETADFSYPNFPVTELDGYANRTDDMLNTTETASDAVLVTIPPYDYRGWKRFRPIDIITGKCVGSYFGGEHYCADGYSGVGRIIRGSNVNDEQLKREEILLETTGQPCMLVKRVWKGMYCACYQANKEYADPRCPICGGGGRVLSWEPYYNPRRSDGRIMVRFDATVDDVPYQDAGLESTYAPNGWTLSTPTINDRDMLITYDKYTDAEVFRYEVLNVTRNALFDQVVGAQKLAMTRVRKTDNFYRFLFTPNTSDQPRIITTSVSSVPGLILPHSHTFQVGPTIISPGQVLTSTSHNGAIVAQAHSHQIRGDSTTLESFSHTHTFVL